MAFDNLTDTARLAINRMVAVTEKEKKLLHKALDAQADAVTGLDNVVEDLTPQLGGDLDFNSQKATSFESTGIDDNATGTRITVADSIATIGSATGYSIINSVDDQYLLISGGDAINSGANIRLYGGITGSSNANKIVFESGTSGRIICTVSIRCKSMDMVMWTHDKRAGI